MMENKKIKKGNKEVEVTVETDECPICGGGNRPDFKKGYGKDPDCMKCNVCYYANEGEF